jgi:hypothetical protein
MSLSASDDGLVRICIIGAGPRGISVLERLNANVARLLPVSIELHIHLVDPFVAFGGRVWNREQDPLLLMNTVACQITVFVDNSVQCEGPVVAGPSLHEWARQVVSGQLPVSLSPWLRREAATIEANTYPSRALYGGYLHWALSHVIRTAGPAVQVVPHAATAVDIRGSGAELQTVLLDDGTDLRGVHAVVLVQGHLAVRGEGTDTRLRRFASRHGRSIVEPGGLADFDQSQVSATDTVLISGLGLCFFDYLALLTVGRGGRFDRGVDGLLRYRRSGFEPAIVAGSRRGVPYHARGENQKGVSGRHEPVFLTRDTIYALRQRSRSVCPLNFRTDIWPLLDAEVRLVYYHALVAARLGSARARRLRERYRDHLVRSLSSARVASAAGAGAEPGQLLAAYGIHQREHWSWQRIEEPFRAHRPSSHAQYLRWLRHYLVNDICHARRGNVTDPLKAAVDVLRDLRNEVRLLVDHGGLDGHSYRKDLQSWYMPLNAFLSIGPPARRVEELLALIDAGVVEILGPQMVVSGDEDQGRFRAHSRWFPETTRLADLLIEARLPAPDIRRTDDVLINNLLTRKECATYKIPSAQSGCFDGGGLAVTEKPYFMLDAKARPNARRLAFGIPTETVHWMTAAGIRPGVNSVILGDSDAVARECLHIGRKDLSSCPAQSQL